MKDSKEVVLQFVKIVERFPVLYDNKLPNRPQVFTLAWEKVAEAVRQEMKEECTVDELRLKWKGIRSSFTRFKKKLHVENKDTSSTKQYYLYDALSFLHSHTKPKWLETSNEDENHNSENDDEWVQNITIKALKDGSNQAAPIRTYSNTKDPLAIEKKLILRAENLEEGSTEIKKEPLDDYTDIKNENVLNDNHATNTEEEIGSIKRRNSSIDTNEASLPKIKKPEESTDLQFFKSIVPDIVHFTTQEKRKFKMGILKLIDEIEESRNNPYDLPDNSEC